MDREVHGPHGGLLVFMSRRHGFPPFLSAPYYPETMWTHTSCLPLVFGSTYTSGLTVFFSNRGLIGMASYGPKNKVATVGWCEGEAVHFPLAPGEYFTSLWVQDPSVDVARVIPPLVTLGTSAGRSAHFGRQRMLRSCLEPETYGDRCEAVRSWAGPTKITGLFVEELGEWGYRSHSRFGVVQEPLGDSDDELALATPTVLDIAFGYPDPSVSLLHKDTFRSTGSLCDVAAIQVRRKLNQCVGMRTILGVGLGDFLGSWDPEDPSSISTIFDSSREAPLTTLLFHGRLKDKQSNPVIVDMATSNSVDSYLESWDGSELRVC